MPGPTTSPDDSARYIRPALSFDQYEKSEVKTLPDLVDFNARFNANHTFCLQYDRRRSDGPFRLTFAQLRDAVISCSEHLMSSQDFQAPEMKSDGYHKQAPVAILAESDLTFLLNLLALISQGIPVLLLSIKLQPAIVAHLMGETGCSTILTSKRMSSVAEEAIRETSKPGAVHTMLNYLEATQKTVDSSAPLTKDGYNSGLKHRNVVIFHTSGSTGLPKSIPVSHQYFALFPTCHQFGPKETLDWKNMTSLPLFHGYGHVAIGFALSLGLPVCMPDATIPSTGPSLIDFINESNAEGVLTVPSLLEEIIDMNSEAAFDTLRSLHYVAAGGAPLKQDVGETLKKAGIPILNHFGSTESGPLGAIRVVERGDDWVFWPLRSDVPSRLSPLEKTNGETRDLFSLTVFPPGWEEEYTISDRFEVKQASNTTWLKSLGRSDNVLVLSNGEKIDPTPMEAHLRKDPRVHSVVVFGDGKEQTGAIIRPATPVPAENVKSFKTELWEAVTKGNEQMDKHGQVTSTDALVILGPGDDFPRTDKGSINRRQTYTAFEKQIEGAYEALAGSSAPSRELHLDSLEDDLRTVINQDLQAWWGKAGTWSSQDDLFELGMDSLQATLLKRAVLTSLPSLGLKEQAKMLPSDFIYRHSNLDSLCQMIRGLAGPANGLAETNDEPALQTFEDKYRVDISSDLAVSDKQNVVLLTGSTGSLGAHTLQQLATSKSFAKVVCLVRSTDPSQDPKKRQEEALERRHIKLSDEAWSKIEVLRADLASEQLGLSSEQWQGLKQEVSHVLHAAWPMSFQRRLGSFGTQFKTVQTLLRLTCEASMARPRSSRPKFVFVSSVAAVGRYPRRHDAASVPEAAVEDEDTLDMGYGKAKLVCERIVADCAKRHRSLIEASSVRVGQVSASRDTGYWNEEEHVYAMVRSSQSVGCLPSMEGTYSWLAVDDAARVLVDILANPSPPILHLESPLRQQWGSLLSVLSKKLSLQVVGYDEWMTKIEGDGDGDDVDARCPAKKLIGFFRDEFRYMSCGSITLDTTVCRAVSPALRGVGAFEDEYIGRFLEAWKAEGLLE